MNTTKKNISKATKSAETKNTKAITTIEKLTTSIDFSKVDIEKCRKEQQKTLDKATIELLLGELKKTFSNLDFSIMSNKYYYCINIKRDNKLICKYWAKQIFARLVVNSKLLERIKSIDASKRYAMHNDQVFNNELLCSYTESVNVLKDITTEPEIEKKTETAKK